MKHTEKRDLLVQDIEDILQQGLPVDSGVQHYIDSTFSNPTLQELEGIILDDVNPDRDALLELLFFPDEDIKIRIETLLQNESLDSTVEEELISSIAAQKKTVTFYFKSDGAFSLPMPEAAVRQFVYRLNLSSPLDKRLTAAIDRHVQDDLRAIVKVRLRGRVKNPQDDKIAFLCDFFKKMRSQSRLFLNSLNFIIHFLNELNTIDKIYDDLVNRKWFLFQNIQKSKMLEQKLQKSNIETLMMQGIRLTGIDMADTRLKMEVIDCICRTMFGKTEYFASMGEQAESAQFDQNDEMDDIIKKIS